MKHFKFRQLLFIAAGFALFSCEKDEGPKEQESPPMPILFSSGVNVYSKATDAGFEVNDQIGVYVTQWSGNTQPTLTSSGNYVDNQLYTYASGGFSSSPVVYYPKDGSKVDVYAYYPRVSSASATNIAFAVKADQSSQTGYTQSDLMVASAFGKSSSTSPIPLAFSHTLSKIVIKLDGNSVPSGTVSIKLGNIYTNCKYNLSNGECTTTGSKSQLTLRATGNNTFTGILPPQSFDNSQVLATISIGGTDYTWKPSTSLNFLGNAEYEYTLYFEKNGDPVTFTATINPWGKPKIDNVVPPEIQARIEQHMPIYNGGTPPNVMGTYLVNPTTMIHSSIPGDMDVDYDFADMYLRFYNQNTTDNTLDYDEKQGTGSSATGKGVFISGSGKNFTVFFNTTGVTSGISTKEATVISGTITSGGISNYRYAFVMLEKGSDPKGLLVDVGTLRVFKDGNELASIASWPANTKKAEESTGRSVYDMWKKK